MTYLFGIILTMFLVKVIFKTKYFIALEKAKQYHYYPDLKDINAIKNNQTIY